MTEAVIARSKKRLVASALLSALVALVVAATVVALGGITFVTVVVMLACGALAAIVVFDYPISTTFDTTGFIRSTVARRRVVEWPDVDSISRANTRPRGLKPTPTVRLPQSGGLVGTVGRRRLWLCDQVESPRTYEAMRAYAEAAGVEVRAQPCPNPANSHRA